MPPLNDGLNSTDRHCSLGHSHVIRIGPAANPDRRDYAEDPCAGPAGLTIRTTASIDAVDTTIACSLETRVYTDSHV